MNAKDAYKKAYEANTNAINTQYNEIQKKIIGEAEKGKYKMFWYDYILPDVKKRLEFDGFNIGKNQNVKNFVDVTIEISWDFIKAE